MRLSRNSLLLVVMLLSLSIAEGEILTARFTVLSFEGRPAPGREPPCVDDAMVSLLILRQ